MRLILKLVASLTSFRGLLLVLSFALLLAPLSIAWFDLPHRWLFQVGVQLSPKPEPATQIVKVTVNQREMDRLASDIAGAVSLGELLSSLKGVYTKAIIVLLDDVPVADNYAVEVVNKGILQQEVMRDAIADTPLWQDLQSLVSRQDIFETGVADGTFILGIAQKGNAQDKISFLRESQRVQKTHQEVRSPLSAVLDFDQGAFDADILELAAFRFESNLQGLAYYDGLSPAYPLLWKVNDAVFPDIALEALRKSVGAKAINYQSRTLTLDDKSFVLSAGAVIYPFYSVASGKSAPIETISLTDLQTTRDYGRFHNKLVLIGVKDSSALENVASAIYSLEKQAYFVVPASYLLVEKGAILVLLAYVLLLLPRLGIKVGLALSAVLLIGLVILQWVLQITQKQWLPVALLVCYLMLGHLLFLFTLICRRIFGEWQLVVIEKGAPLPSPKKLDVRVRNEPRLSITKSATGKLNQMFDRTMALTKPSGKLKFGRYEVDRELGRGAMGVVYLGHDTSLDRLVAIKTLNFSQFEPHQLIEAKERFFREAKAIAAKNFEHENIVQILERGEDAERAFIVMQFVDGKPLSAYTQKNTLIKDYDVLYWIIECVADALGYAHDKGIIHRDIKPSNILYDEENGKVKVSDFGIARVENSSATGTGEILGSPLYMSPEQIRGEKLTGKTDIYSLGVTFYQLLTGEVPFKGDNIPAITHQIVQGKYIPVHELNPRLPASAQKILAKAMHKDPDRRYTNAREMMEDIAKYRVKEF
jgi:predicted Ser/Thr protein kinase